MLLPDPLFLLLSRRRLTLCLSPNPTDTVLRRIPFLPGEASIPEGVHVTHAASSDIMRVMAVTLSDGSAVCISSRSASFDRKVLGAWLPLPDTGVDAGVRLGERWLAPSSSGMPPVPHAVRVRLNPRFSLLAVGMADGRVHMYRLGGGADGVGATWTHTLVHPMHHGGAGAGAAKSPGVVNALEWSPDGYALAVGTERAGLSLWSVFGRPLMHASEESTTAAVAVAALSGGTQHVTWAPEGYDLTVLGGGPAASLLVTMQLVRSAMVTDPSLSNQCNALLIGTDRLCVSHESGATGLGANVDKLCDVQWQSLEIPVQYLSGNWPIRHAVMDEGGMNFAIAGQRGTCIGPLCALGDLRARFPGRFSSPTSQLLCRVHEALAPPESPRLQATVVCVAGIAHYSRSSRRWRLFGNVSQEQQFACVGGLAWWRNHIIVACRDVHTGASELRVYPKWTTLDNSNLALKVTVPAPVQMMNCLADYLLVLFSNRRLRLYRLARTAAPAAASPQDVLPVRASRVLELDLRQHCTDVSSIVALSLARVGTEEAADPRADRPGALVANIAGHLWMFALDVGNRPGEADSIGAAPMLLATSVESHWVPYREGCMERHLMQALWLSCGRLGMKVWLPLYAEARADGPGSAKDGEAFLAKRIMLSFNLDQLGYPLSVLFDDAVVLGARHDLHCSSPRDATDAVAVFSLERKTQLYVHNILKQLIRRNLQEHALAIAQSLVSLPYFPHVLELLLHEVLEEEGGSDVPPEGAILPAVLKFVAQFPSYLDVVVHCARKTELVKWPYLFDSLQGDPDTLFEECIEQGKYGTAASYLMIMQTLTSPSASRKRALSLLNTALNKHLWDLSRDLVRFLEATAEVSGSTEDLRVVAQSPSKETADRLFAVHAFTLLQGCRLRALGRMAANLDFDLAKWLPSLRKDAVRLKDFSAALDSVLEEFELMPGEQTLGMSVDVTDQMDRTAVIPSSALVDRPVSEFDTSLGDISVADAEVSTLVEGAGMEGRATTPTKPIVSTSGLERGVASASSTLERNSVFESSAAAPLRVVANDDSAAAGLKRASARTAVKELEFMCNLMHHSGCHDWALLLAAVLKDEAAINAILDDLAVSGGGPNESSVYSVLKQFSDQVLSQLQG